MDKSTIIEVPVLLIGFNRPDVIKKSLVKLRESKPVNMYFACDGPRSEKSGEDKTVQSVRSLFDSEIDWPCEKHYRYNDVNKGCETTVSEAISWVLNNNDYVIVLEDDIIAPYAFLKFAQEMLYKYKDCDQIYQISSDNYTPIPLPNGEDYCFSRYGHIWGWATWKRAWAHFNLYDNDFKSTVKKMPRREDLTKKEKKRFRDLCLKLQRQERTKQTEPKHTWDFMWSYIKWREGGLSIVPRVHLSSNIGVIGFHATGQSKAHYLTYDENFEVKKHPEEILVNNEYDDYHYNHWIKPPFLAKRVLNKLISIIRKKS